MLDLIQTMSVVCFIEALANLNDYAELLALSVNDDLPEGKYEFMDYMDDDGQGLTDIPIKTNISISKGALAGNVRRSALHVPHGAAHHITHG